MELLKNFMQQSWIWSANGQSLWLPPKYKGEGDSWQMECKMQAS